MVPALQGAPMIAVFLLACTDPASVDPTDDAAPQDTGGDVTDDLPSDTTTTDTGTIDTSDTVPSEDADPDVRNQIPPDYVPTDPVRILFLGDSITEGYGASSSEQKYTSLLQHNFGWPGFEDIDFEDDFPNLSEVVDVSEGGATAGSLLDLQLPALERELDFPVVGETIVIVTIAGNDLQTALIPFADAETIVNRTLREMEELADWFLDPAKFPDGVYLYATNVYEPTDGIGQVQGCFFGIDFSEDLPQLDRFNGELAAMGADRGFAVLDLRGHFIGHGYRSETPTVEGYDPADPTLWFAPDCIHPNDRGHHELRRLFHAAITGAEFTYQLP